MKKRLLAIIICIVMVVGLLPVTALAADPTVYDIWVDGVQVTSENKDNLFSGTVSYDPTTHTLSLNNATLDKDTKSGYGIKTNIPSTLKMNCTPFVRQYDILSKKWGVLLCQKEYQTNDIRRSSREWL